MAHDYYEDPRMWARARLIAAAPELLEALEMLARTAPDVPCQDTDDHQEQEAWKRFFGAIRLAKVVIAKARGES